MENHGKVDREGSVECDSGLGVRGLHAEINQALDAAWEAGYQARAKGEERASEREIEAAG